MKKIHFGPTVIDAEIETRMRAKMWRKLWWKIGLVFLLILIVFLRLFGNAFLRKVLHYPWNFSFNKYGNEMFVPRYPEPVKIEPNAKVFDLMYDAAMKGGETFEFDTKILECNTAGQANDIVNATFGELLDERIEVCFWGGVQTDVQTSEDGKAIGKKTQVTFLPYEQFEKLPLKKYCRDMQKGAEEIVRQASKLDTDLEKALFAHDYIAAHTVYDFDGVDADGYDLCHTAYGAIGRRSAVCAGYAAGYNYVLRLLGVESRYMTGNVKKNLWDKLFPLTMKDGGHAWNLVKLDGDWYWVDVTWDDTGLDPDEDGIQVMHEYCFVDDDKIFESRKLDSTYHDVPKCRSMKLNEKLLEADAEAAANAG